MNKPTKKITDQTKETPTLVVKKKSPVRMRPTPIHNTPCSKTGSKTPLRIETMMEKTCRNFVRFGSLRSKPLVSTQKLNLNKRMNVSFETPKTDKNLNATSATKLLKESTTKNSCKNAEKVQGKSRNFANVLDRNRIKENLESIRKGMRNVKISHKKKEQYSQTDDDIILEAENLIKALQTKIASLEDDIAKLQSELLSKQIDAKFLEEMITLRDGLCQDLQNKLSESELKLKDSYDSLDLIKSHHKLALEANESIRKEYRAEIDCLKNKLDDEKQQLASKSISDLKELKEKYEGKIKEISENFKKELDSKDLETSAKIAHFQEKSAEQLRLSEIQYEQRIHDIQGECNKLQYDVQLLQDKNRTYEVLLQNENDKNNDLQSEIDHLKSTKEINTGMDCTCENEINKLKAHVARITDENQKYEISLMITHDTVNILSQRLRQADQEVENLERSMQFVESEKQKLLQEVDNLKTRIDAISTESNNYRESLVKIIKSKSNLVEEHNRIMEHNVSLVESLSNIEQEAYNEFGAIKNGLLADIDVIKTEAREQLDKMKHELHLSNSGRDEARREAANVAAQCSQLLRQAETSLQQLEEENIALKLQIQDQQAFTAELVDLQEENEKLATRLAEQSSMIDQLRCSERLNEATKSPVQFGKQKSLKLGKENSSPFVSPLKERNY